MPISMQLQFSLLTKKLIKKKPADLTVSETMNFIIEAHIYYMGVLGAVFCF